MVTNWTHSEERLFFCHPIIKLFRFNIYPNPVLSTLNIQLDKNSSDFSVIIYDVSGKVIFSEYNFSKLNNPTIDVSHLSSGMYLIAFSFQGKIDSRTFYKK